MKRSQGFTLIELSIVLVIIGLIVGGVLVGRDLIAAAQIRAQITQIEKFNQAVNTFYGKFQAIPGDMDTASAAKFGLPVHMAPACQVVPNDGILQGYANSDCGPSGQGGFETGQIWTDLSSDAGGRLIDVNLSGINGGDCLGFISSSNASHCFPTAKIGNGTNFIGILVLNNKNWYQLGSVVGNTYDNQAPGYSALTVSQAYNIDKKMDDGMPATGKVIGGDYSYPNFNNTSGIAASAYTCWDNGGVAQGTMKYSIAWPGSGVNCVMGFQFQ